MNPRPPFADELTHEQELAAFERLKPRLNEVWDVISAREDLPATSIVVPSFTLDQEELTKLEGAAFYEERLLFLLIRLRNPRAHVTYVTSQPVHPLILDYYLHLLAGVPASHARARLRISSNGSPLAISVVNSVDSGIGPHAATSRSIAAFASSTISLAASTGTVGRASIT